MKLTKSNLKSRRVFAEDTMDSEVTIDPAAVELLFETQDVADLISEVTGEDVSVEMDEAGEAVTFTVGDDEITVTPEEDAEIVESAKSIRSARRPVVNSKRPNRRSTVSASRKNGVVVRRINKR